MCKWPLTKQIAAYDAPGELDIAGFGSLHRRFPPLLLLPRGLLLLGAESNASTQRFNIVSWLINRSCPLTCAACCNEEVNPWTHQETYMLEVQCHQAPVHLHHACQSSAGRQQQCERHKHTSTR